MVVYIYYKLWYTYIYNDMLWSNNFKSNKQILCGPPESLQRNPASHLDLVVHRMWRDAIRSEEQLWAAVEDRTRYLGASKVGPMMLNAPKNHQKRGFSAWKMVVESSALKHSHEHLSIQIWSNIAMLCHFEASVLTADCCFTHSTVETT